jgi:hypothetical protein
VATVPMTAGTCAFVLAHRSIDTTCCLFIVDLVGTYAISPLVEGASSSAMDYQTGPLTGATGVSGRATFGLHTDNNLYVENRQTLTATWVLWILG